MSEYDRYDRFLFVFIVFYRFSTQKKKIETKERDFRLCCSMNLFQFIFFIVIMRRCLSFLSAPSLSSLRLQKSCLLRSTFSTQFDTRPGNPRFALQDALRSWRKRTADEMQQPIYRVMNNQLLQSVAVSKPRSKEQLALLHGVGRYTLNRYGNMILDIVKVHSPDEEVLSPEETVAVENFWLEAKEKKGKKAKPKTKKKTSKVDLLLSGMNVTGLATGKTSSKGRKSRVRQMTDDEIAQLSEEKIPFEQLNDEQKEATQQILSGKNYFVTGNAGTGKTYLMKYIIQELIDRYGEDAVAVTAPTGIAAVNLNGQTIHSFAGIGLGQGEKSHLVKLALKTSTVVERWLKCKTLIIDEVSMLDKRLFEVLDAIGKTIRDSQEPFGGIQLIVVGDFLQLPPVRKSKMVVEVPPESSDSQMFDEEGNIIPVIKKTPTPLEFCFQSPVWIQAGLHLQDSWINLKKAERQSSDQEFITYLNEIRLGILSNKCLQKLNECLVTNKRKPSNGIIPTKLYAVNRQVDEENLQRLQELPGEIVTMEALDKWKKKPSRAAVQTHLKTSIGNQIPEKIDLKVGAQVMLLRNRSRMTFGGQIRLTGPSLVNGSRGKVIGFTESVQRPGMMVPTVEFDNGMVTTIGPVEFTTKTSDGEGEIVRSQVPLKLAW
jgi:hypothetical protein